MQPIMNIKKTQNAQFIQINTYKYVMNSTNPALIEYNWLYLKH